MSLTNLLGITRCDSARKMVDYRRLDHTVVLQLKSRMDLVMKHLDVVDGVEERPVPGIIGQNLDLVILKLRSPDAEVWTASTATPAAAGLDSTHYQEYILLSNGLIQRTPCECTLTNEVISYIDDRMIAQLGDESISFTDASTVRVATVHVQQSCTELACFRSFFK